MRWTALLGILLTGVVMVFAAPEFPVQVAADSVFTRALPAENAERTASVFENDNLIAIGRNADGLWLQVRRPARDEALGWLRRRVLRFDFDVAALPITDFRTGVTGATPVKDTGFAVQIGTQAALRTLPERGAARLTTIPVFVTIPVIERTPDNQWVKVNYLGTVGWIAEYLTGANTVISSVPVSAEYANDPRYAPFEVIPREVQLAQADRLLAWLDSAQQTAQDVARYWQQLNRGETLECLPPADVPAFRLNAQDVKELPELRRQERLLTQATADINTAIAAMRRCGVYLPREIQTAYGQAQNALAALTEVRRRIVRVRDQIAPRS